MEQDKKSDFAAMMKAAQLNAIDFQGGSQGMDNPEIPLVDLGSSVQFFAEESMNLSAKTDHKRYEWEVEQGIFNVLKT